MSKLVVVLSVYELVSFVFFFEDNKLVFVRRINTLVRIFEENNMNTKITSDGDKLTIRERQYMYVLCNLILKEKSFTHYSHWDCCCCNQWQNSKGGTEKKWRIMFVACQAKAVIEKSFYSEVTPNSGSSRSQANDVTRRSRYLLRTLFINAMCI